MNSSLQAMLGHVPQLQVLSGRPGPGVAPALQQDAVKGVLVIDVPAGHQDVLAPLCQQGAVTGVGDPDKLPVHYGEVVPVGVLDLNIIASLLANIAFFKNSSTKNYGESKTRIKLGHRELRGYPCSTFHYSFHPLLFFSYRLFYQSGQCNLNCIYPCNDCFSFYRAGTETRGQLLHLSLTVSGRS